MGYSLLWLGMLIGFVAEWVLLDYLWYRPSLKRGGGDSDTKLVAAQTEIELLRAELSDHQSVKERLAAFEDGGALPAQADGGSSRVREVEQQLAAIQANAEAELANLDQNKDILSSLRGQIEEVEQELEAAESKVAILQANADDPTGESLAQIERFETLQSELSAAKAQIGQMTQKVEEYDSLVNAVEILQSENKAIPSLQEQLIALQSELENRRTESEKYSAQIEESDRLRLQNDQLLAKQAELEAQTDSDKLKISEVQAHYEALLAEHDSLSSKHKDAQLANAELNNQYSELKSAHEALKGEMEGLSNATADTSELDSIKRAFEQLQQDHEQMKARYDALALSRENSEQEQNELTESHASLLNDLREQLTSITAELEEQKALNVTLEQMLANDKTVESVIPEIEEPVEVEATPVVAESASGEPTSGKKTRKLMAEIDRLSNQNEEARKRLEAYKNEIVGLQTQLVGLTSEEMESEPLTDLTAMTPEIAEKLTAAGIKNYSQLASLQPERVQDIIEPISKSLIEVSSWIAEASERARGA